MERNDAKMPLKLKHRATAKTRFRLPLHAYLMYLLIGAFLLTGVSFARYISTGSGQDGARVAAGKVTVSHDPNTMIEMSRPDDDGSVTRQFAFNVSNQNSEVAIRYDVIVNLSEPLPNGVSMMMDNTPCSESAQTVFTFKNAGVFPAGNSDIKTHTLSFTGDYSLIGEESSRTITISIRAEQIN